MAFVALFILLYYFMKSIIDTRYTVHYNYAPRIYWMYLWTLLLGAYFAGDHLKSLRIPGKVFIDYAHLIIAFICIALNFIAFPLFGFIVGNFAPILGIIFWNSIIHMFYKDTFCNRQK